MNIKIGDTPLIKIKYEYDGKQNYIYTKLEFYNISGSIKDRVAYYIIKKAYQEGTLKKGMEIVEATSENTGISLSALGAFFGNHVHIFMPDWVSQERLKLMKMYNAKVTLISKEEDWKKLKEYDEDIKIYALEPDKMPLLSQNRIIENHKIEGIGDDFIPKIVKKEKIYKIFLINDEDAINMSRKIALDLGIGVGISSGANMIASILAR